MNSDITGGYTMWARQLLNSEVWEKPPHYLKILIWLVMTANWTDNELKRGQVCTSYTELQDLGTYKIGNRLEGKLTIDQVRSAVGWLAETGTISTVKTRHGIMITIENYDKYQNSANYCSGHQPGTSPKPSPKTARSGCSSFRIAIAWSGNGIMCGSFIFILRPGI